MLGIVMEPHSSFVAAMPFLCSHHQCTKFTILHILPKACDFPVVFVPIAAILVGVKWLLTVLFCFEILLFLFCV